MTLSRIETRRGLFRLAGVSLTAAALAWKEGLALAEEPRWESLAISPGDKFHLETDTVTNVASIWDGTDPKTVKVLVIPAGRGGEIPGPWRGTRWRVFDEGVADTVNKARELANKERVSAQLPADFNVPVIWGGVAQYQDLPTVVQPGWNFWGSEQQPAVPEPTLQPDGRTEAPPELPDLDPYKGMDWVWDNNGRGVPAIPKGPREVLVVESGEWFVLLQGWNLSHPESTHQILVGPQRRLHIPGPVAGTLWRVKGDRELIAVRGLVMAEEKTKEHQAKGINHPVPTVWAMGGQPRAGYIEVPRTWTLE